MFEISFAFEAKRVEQTMMLSKAAIPTKKISDGSLTTSLMTGWAEHSSQAAPCPLIPSFSTSRSHIIGQRQRQRQRQ